MIYPFGKAHISVRFQDREELSVYAERTSLDRGLSTSKVSMLTPEMGEGWGPPSGDLSRGTLALPRSAEDTGGVSRGAGT